MVLLVECLLFSAKLIKKKRSVYLFIKIFLKYLVFSINPRIFVRKTKRIPTS